MKFKAPGEQPIHIALTSGHTAVVTPEGTDLEPKFSKEAVARGCIPVGVHVEDEPQGPAGFDRATEIRNAINEMLNGSDDEDFTSDGLPNLNRLSKRVGFGVERSERDAIWAEISNAIGAAGQPNADD